VVDKRADIWAFGVVLYELLTGRRPFHGNDLSEMLASVMKDAPDLTSVPAQIRPLLESCLEKDPNKRLRDIGDAWRVGQGHALPAKISKLAWIAPAVLALALATVSFVHFSEKPAASVAPMRFQIPSPDNTPLGYFDVSPDGRRLAFVAGNQMWVRSLETGDSRVLASNTHGVPFWSPDSRFIGYLSGEPLKLTKIEVNGGSPQTVLEVGNGNWGGGNWGRDDPIAYSFPSLGLFQIPASGGAPVKITELETGETKHFGPSFLPDGRHFVYQRTWKDEGKSGIYLGSLDAKPKQQSLLQLVASLDQPRYVSSADAGTGYLLFKHDDTLLAQPFDNRRLQLKGEAAPIATQVADNAGGFGGWAAFSASNTGVLVYHRNTAL